MNFRRAKWHLILATLFAAVALSPVKAQDTVTLRLDFSIAGYHAPFYYGVAKGFYRDQKIDLQILEGKGSANSITLAGTGANDFAFADQTTAARLIAQGLPVKNVMGIMQKPALAIFFPIGKGIQKPTDLMGKKIAICPADGMAQYVPAYLKEMKMKPSDVEFITVDCSAKYATVAQGRADALGTYIPGGTHNMSSVGINNSSYFSFADAGLSMPAHGIVASNKLIEDNSDLVERFLAATATAWTDSRSHVDEAVNALMDANPLIKEDRRPAIRDDLIVSFNYLVPHAGKPFGWQPSQDWEATKDLLVEFAGVPESVKSVSFFTNDLLPRRR